MAEQVQKKFSERGWGWLLGQISPVAENILQRLGRARSTAGSTEPVCTKPAVEPLSPLSPEEWINMMDNEGRFSPENAHELMRRAFYGGFSEDIRCEAWKYLLRLYPLASTEGERTAILRDKAADYHVLKMQWQTMLPEQLKRCTKFVNTRAQIEKDIVRTDRDYFFFKDEESLDVLREILLTFFTYNRDLGYAQGMNDLCAIILNVLQGDEVCTFWCFANLMERLGPHFHKDQVGMTTTLRALARVLRVVDPELYGHLESVGASNMFFCFRWMLIFFKREFSFDSTKRVWEALLSDFLAPHFELFFACAMVEDSRDKILRDRMKLDELMLMMNELAGTRKTTPLIQQADALFHKFVHSPADPEIHDYVLCGLHSLSDAVVPEEAKQRPRAASATARIASPPPTTDGGGGSGAEAAREVPVYQPGARS